MWERACSRIGVQGNIIVECYAAFASRLAPTGDVYEVLLLACAANRSSAARRFGSLIPSAVA